MHRRSLLHLETAAAQFFIAVKSVRHWEHIYSVDSCSFAFYGPTVCRTVCCQHCVTAVGHWTHLSGSWRLICIWAVMNATGHHC